MTQQTATPVSAVIPSQKIYYLDHLKVLLTILVILHHTFITYGAPGGWYYLEPTANQVALIPMTLFVALNQAFFMGLFFFMSAYFIAPSLDRKGSGMYLKDRLKRLGIPLIFYSFLLSPFLKYLAVRYGDHEQITYFQFLSRFKDWVDFGVLWFVAALLIFTLSFVWLKSIKGFKLPAVGLPGFWRLLLSFTLLGAVTYLIRFIFPVGWILKPLGFQLGHFPQYITLFSCGLLARKNNWLEQLDNKTAKRFGWLALVMIAVVFPLIFFIKNSLGDPLNYFMGGWHFEAVSYGFWEQITGLSLIVWLVGWAKAKWNRPSPFLTKLSRDSFAVYIFHPLFLIGIALLLSVWSADPAVKLFVTGPCAVISSFLLAAVLVKIPGINRII